MSIIKVHQELIEEFINANCPQQLAYGEQLQQSIAYSFCAPGKRIRPLLFLSLLYCHNLKVPQFLSFAVALEALHCYSLIHDDLPSLDNDDFRRGKPSNHIVFGEATAILAGDSLLTLAFEMASRPLPIDSQLQILMINKLAMLAGSQKLVVGQQADLDFQNREIKGNLEKQISFININKTSALFKASLEIAAIACKIEDNLVNKLAMIADLLGLNFQNNDDISEFQQADQDQLILDKKKFKTIQHIGLKNIIAKNQAIASKLQSEINSLPEKYIHLKELLKDVINKKIPNG